MKLKKIVVKIFRLYPLILLLGVVVFDIIRTHHKKMIFFKSELATIVVKKKNNLTGGRTYDYITKNKIVLTIPSQDSNNVEIGDSVVKNKNSWQFDLYKKNKKGEYNFYKRCHLYEWNGSVPIITHTGSTFELSANAANKGLEGSVFGSYSPTGNGNGFVNGGAAIGLGYLSTGASVQFTLQHTPSTGAVSTIFKFK